MRQTIPAGFVLRMIVDGWKSSTSPLAPATFLLTRILQILSKDSFKNMHLKNLPVRPGLRHLKPLLLSAAVSMLVACSPEEKPKEKETAVPPPPAAGPAVEAAPEIKPPAAATAVSETPPPSATVAAEVPSPASPATLALTKIKFNLQAIGEDGLREQAGGRGPVAYEYCIPKDDAIYEEVRSLDPGVQIHPTSYGRGSCGPDKALCIGSTRKAGWRQALEALAAKDYITEIRELF